MDVLKSRKADEARPVASHATLVLTLAAGLSMMIYALIFARMAPLPDLYNIPHVQMHWIDKDMGIARAELIVSFIALGVLNYIAWKAAHYAKDWVDWAIVATAAVGFGLALLFMYPFGAADLFDNIMHGRILTVYHGNPFVNIINQYPADPFVPYTAWRYSPSAYGPLWELAAGLTVRLAGNGIAINIVAFKLLPGIFWILTMAVAAIMLYRAKIRPALPAFLLLAWNPMMLYEVWGNGHNDMAMAFFVLLAAWMMLEKRYTLAILALVGGTLFKYMPILLVPTAGLIALRALPDNRRRAIFIVTAAAASAALIAVSFAPFWHGIETLTIGRRAEMISGSPASAIYSVMTEVWKWDKAKTATTISTILAFLTVSFSIFMGFRAMRKPTWQSFVSASFTIFMVYLMVLIPWYQQWYAIWPTVLIPFLPPLAQGLGVVFSYTVLGKQLWVDPTLFWQRIWSPLPNREIAFAIGNLVFGWIAAAYVLGKLWERRHAPARASVNAPAAPAPRAGSAPIPDLPPAAIPVTGEEEKETAYREH